MQNSGKEAAMTRIRKTMLALAGIASCLGAGLGQAQALDEVRFATNWKAQAEHGGFYQAVADGTYEKYGLKVTILQGGPRMNGRMLMVAGKTEFYMGGNMLGAFNSVREGLPAITVAAIFQKEPQAILTHPGVAKSWDDLKSLTLLIADGNYVSSYRWMMQAYGFTAEQRRPYTFNPAPFLVDRNVGMQGYITSEPYLIEKTAGFKPDVWLLADYGFSSYSTTIETRPELVENKPDLVQRFVDASIIGWYNYLHGENAKANALIRNDNPEMTDDKVAHAIASMKANGILESGDALELGIGAMTDARIQDFYGKMVAAGVLEDGIDTQKTYTLHFVNHRVGMDLR